MTGHDGSELAFGYCLVQELEARFFHCDRFSWAFNRNIQRARPLAAAKILASQFRFYQEWAKA